MNQLATTTIERPKRTRGKPTDDGDFVVFEHVCCFDEHTGDDGVVYDERLLHRIAENCNRRIRTTGDYCPIVVAHTRDQDEKSSVDDDPQVIGLAGPFYVSDFVNTDGVTVKAIYSTFWIFAEDEKLFLKNPRRSVEIWPEDKPENRYFDPLAVLGAETPKRDLGLIYSRGRPGYRPTRYAMGGPLRYSKRTVAKSIKYQESAPASVPGGNNTFIPGSNPKKKPQQHAKGAPAMPGTLSPDDLNQIIEALKPTIQSMIDTSGMIGDDMGGDLAPPPPDAGGGVPPIPPPDEASGSPEMPPDDGIPSPDSMDDDSQLYARGLGRKFMKYFKDDGDLDDAGADGFMGSLDDDDKAHLGSYMKYMCDDDDKKQKYSQRYAKCPIGGTDMTEKPGDSSPSGSMNAAEMKNGEPERYGKSTHYAKIKGERDEAVRRYSKLHKENEELKVKYAKQNEALKKLRTQERYAKRLTRFTTLANQYAFDPEEEMELTEDFTDAQFDRHCDRVIPERYSKVSGELLPVGAAPKLKDGTEDKSQRYAKACGDAVQKYRKAGKNVDYGTVMRHMIDNDGKIDEETLFASQTNGNGHAH